MSERKKAALAGLVLCLILVFHLVVAWQDIATLSRNGFLYDDSFYAFKIAHNIAEGRGMTFDGVHPTTGFQPLYVLLLVPVYMLAGGDLITPIYIALTLSALLTALTAWLVYRLARRYTGFVPALAAAAVWGLSPIVTKQGANGLETALSTFMIGLSVYYYLEYVRGEWRAGAMRLCVLGMLLGITVLSRIDGVFLVLVMALDYLLVLRRRKNPARAIRQVMTIVAGVLVFYGPWLAVNVMESGTPLQDSGTATRFLSMAYATYFDNGGAEIASEGPDAAFILEHFKHSLSTLKVAPPAHVIFRSADKLGEMTGTRGVLHPIADVLGLLALAGALLAVLRWRGDPERARRRELDFMLWLSGLLIMAYSAYIFGAFFFMRYFYPVFLTMSVFLAFFIQDAINWVKRQPAASARAVLAGTAAYAALFCAFTWSQTFRTRPIYPFYDIARWVDMNTSEGERIGVFQCGMIGYFSHREIVNLDGKVNREALCALKAGEICRYMKEEGIDLVVDHASILQIFLETSHENLRRCCVEIPPGSGCPPSGWVALDPGSILRRADAEETSAESPPVSSNTAGARPASSS